MSGNIAERVFELASPPALRMGLEIIETAFVRESGEWYLRLYIDKRGGVGIDDCERLSKELSAILDDADLIDRAYNLEVSSPGLDRPLKTEADFLRHEGELLEIRMLPGKLKDVVIYEPAAPNATAQGSGGPATPNAAAQGSGGPPKSGGREGGRSRAPAKRTGQGPSKKAGQAPSGADMIQGILRKFENGRVYLADERDNCFSIAWEDIKTAKRA